MLMRGRLSSCICILPETTLSTAIVSEVSCNIFICAIWFDMYILSNMLFILIGDLHCYYSILLVCTTYQTHIHAIQRPHLDNFLICSLLDLNYFKGAMSFSMMKCKMWI